MNHSSYAGQDNLIIVDCHISWPVMIPMTRNITTTQITTAIRQAFCRTTIPDIVWFDGGLQFTSAKFNQFAQQWGSLHKKLSPYHPQSDRKIKSAVKLMKKSFTLQESSHLGSRQILPSPPSVQKHPLSKG